MATKLDLSFISDGFWWGKLTHNDPLVTWSCEVTWQIENLISSLPQTLWPPNMVGWELMVRGTHLWSHMILWQRNTSSLTRPMAMKIGNLVTYGEVNAPRKWHIPPTNWSRDKLKANYFFLQMAYDQQTLQGTDIWWGKAFNQVTRLWSHDHKRSRVNLKT